MSLLYLSSFVEQMCQMNEHLQQEGHETKRLGFYERQKIKLFPLQFSWNNSYQISVEEYFQVSAFKNISFFISQFLLTHV